MKELSAIAMAISPSATLAVDGLAKKMRADGLDVIGFGAGEPDFSTPDNINKAAIEAINTGKTKYTPAAGMVTLRKAVARRLSDDFGIEYDPADIVVASGAKHNVYIALRTLVNPGDEVIIPAPYWVTYTEAVAMVGGVPVVVYADEAHDFKITAQQLEEAITDKTKAIIINNPSNPTGMIYSEAELRAITDVCLKHDLYIIADEIYSALVYDKKPFTSIASLGAEVKEHTILVSGVSKAYAMTGWRIGFAASNMKIAKIMGNYLSHSTSAPSTISQYAAMEALSGPQEGIAAMCAVFERRRNYICSRINAMNGVSCLIPEGAFYVMLNVEKQIGRTLGGRVIKNGDDFAMSMLETVHVAAVPCSSFGAPNFVRLTYAASDDDIREGMDRLEKFIAE